MNNQSNKLKAFSTKNHGICLVIIHSKKKA
jgi:hypothetical protein